MFDLSRHCTILRSYHPGTRGFSILMAMGFIGILLIVVIGLSISYIREMKLSRTSYDEILAQSNAEGMFEYAMLKVRNHREGFQDIVSGDQIDGGMLVPTTLRASGMRSQYEIMGQSSDDIFSVLPDQHLVVPLFVASGVLISSTSRDPRYNTDIQKTEELNIDLGYLPWTIVAMSGSESIGLTGSGNIVASKTGIMRHRSSQCYRGDTGDMIPCSSFDARRGDEELQYFYDEEIGVSDFIADNADPYIMVFNNNDSPQEVRITSGTPFSLPTLTIRAEAQKNDSVQVFRFTEDKSRYYDALKYGVYNAD